MASWPLGLAAAGGAGSLGCSPSHTPPAGVKPIRHTYGHTHGDVTYVHTLLDKRTTAMYVNLFCRMDSIWLINNAFPFGLSKSRPAVQIGRPAGGTGSIFLLTCGEQNKRVNLLTRHFHATDLSVLTLAAPPVSDSPRTHPEQQHAALGAVAGWERTCTEARLSLVSQGLRSWCCTEKCCVTHFLGEQSGRITSHTSSRKDTQSVNLLGPDTQGAGV